MSLSYDASADETLASAGESATRRRGERLRRGDTLGRYVVLEPLGEGGMGVVYSCYDPELNRKLAIKLLHNYRGVGTRALAAEARLLREAQAMAQLSHPNVVTVHDVGTYEDGVYVAMEFVDCLTLKAWVNEKARSHEEVLEVFLEAGMGLQAAHAKGLIHRDFKPDNVLVAHDGRVLVTDFGLARALDEGPLSDKSGESVVDTEGGRHHWSPNEDALHNSLTQVGSVMGTPAYMAPEQHAGLDTNARADQFSYCVALFEALYGEKPFQGKSVTALALAVTNGEVVELSDDRGVPRWIDAAVRKGMLPTPAQRHADMDELLAALRADPRGARRRLWLALGLVGMVGALVGTQRIAETRAMRTCARGAEEIGRVWGADRASALRRSMVDGDTRRAETLERLIPWLNDYAQTWSDAARETCEAGSIDHRLSPALAREAKRCLDERSDSMDALIGGIPDADARGLYALLESVAELPRVEDCSESAHLGERPKAPEDEAVAARVDGGRRELAKISARRAVGAIAEAQQLSEGLVHDAREIAYDPFLAVALYESGRVAMDAGLPVDAARDFREALGAALRAGLDPLAARCAGWAARALGNQLGEKEEGLAWGEVGWSLHTRAGGAEDLVAAELAVNVGLVHHAAVELDQTEVYYQRALAIRQRVLGRSHPGVALILNNLANIYWARGQFDEALARHKEALAMRESLLGEDHPACASSHNNIGLILHDRAEFEDAIATYRRSIEITRAALGDEHRLVGLTQGNLGGSLEALGRYEEAIVAYAAATRILAGSLGGDSPALLEPARGSARVALAMGRAREAAEALEAAMAKATPRLGVDHADLAEARCELAAMYLELGDFARAKDLLDPAREALVAAYGPENGRVAAAELGLARVDLAAGRVQSALERARRGVRLRENAGHSGASLLGARWVLARAEAATGQGRPLPEVAGELRVAAAELGASGAALLRRIPDIDESGVDARRRP
jgi:tetratricopeptide (TPR) repeat protein/predicted Ser/Thr protein kinase